MSTLNLVLSPLVGTSIADTSFRVSLPTDPSAQRSLNLQNDNNIWSIGDNFESYGLPFMDHSDLFICSNRPKALSIPGPLTQLNAPLFSQKNDKKHALSKLSTLIMGSIDRTHSYDLLDAKALTEIFIDLTTYIDMADKIFLNESDIDSDQDAFDLFCDSVRSNLFTCFLAEIDHNTHSEISQALDELKCLRSIIVTICHKLPVDSHNRKPLIRLVKKCDAIENSLIAYVE